MTRRFLFSFFVFGLFAINCTSVAEKVDFNQHVRPILSDRCFNCHGPDAEARKGKLRLDSEEGSRKALENGWKVISPGDVDHSELLRRINSTDPDEVMPPPEKNLALSSEQKKVLRDWIAGGAEYEGHWAFIPVPNTVEVPETAYENGIDSFVATQHAKESLALSPAADRQTLIRRLCFDLTGLPPTPEEIRAFRE